MGLFDLRPARAPLVNGPRVFRPAVHPSTSLRLTSGTAYWVYAGQAGEDLLLSRVMAYINTGGAGTQTGELGIFSTPKAPCCLGQTLTRVCSTAVIDDMNTSSQMSQNTNSFAQRVPRGTHLWAGVRTAFSSTQPTFSAFITDYGTGTCLVLAGAGAFSSNSSYAGGMLAAAVTQHPFMQITC